MFHRWAALLLVLALCAMSPKNAAGQSQPPPRGQKSAVRKPYPNPFNPEIHIPFPVEPVDGCGDASRQNVVTVRISNILSQEVAIPVLEDAPANSTTSVPVSLVGASLSNVKLVCGDYQAYWSGFVKGTRKEAASGTYLVQVFVNGKPTYSVRILNRK